MKDRRTRQKGVLETSLLIRHHKLEIFLKIRNKNFKEYVVSITQEKIIVKKVHMHIYLFVYLYLSLEIRTSEKSRQRERGNREIDRDKE